MIVNYDNKYNYPRNQMRPSVLIVHKQSDDPVIVIYQI